MRTKNFSPTPFAKLSSYGNLCNKVAGNCYQFIIDIVNLRIKLYIECKCLQITQLEAIFKCSTEKLVTRLSLRLSLGLQKQHTNCRNSFCLGNKISEYKIFPHEEMFEIKLCFIHIPSFFFLFFALQIVFFNIFVELNICYKWYFLKIYLFTNYFHEKNHKKYFASKSQYLKKGFYKILRTNLIFPFLKITILCLNL